MQIGRHLLLSECSPAGAVLCWHPKGHRSKISWPNKVTSTFLDDSPVKIMCKCLGVYMKQLKCENSYASLSSVYPELLILQPTTLISYNLTTVKSVAAPFASHSNTEGRFQMDRICIHVLTSEFALKDSVMKVIEEIQMVVIRCSKVGRKEQVDTGQRIQSQLDTRCIFLCQICCIAWGLELIIVFCRSGCFHPMVQMPGSYIEAPWSRSWLWLLTMAFWQHWPWQSVVLTWVIALLTPMWETWDVLLDPGFSPGPAPAIRSTWEWASKSVSQSIDQSLWTPVFKQRKMLKVAVCYPFQNC